MVECADNRDTRTSGMNTWRAGCGESRTSGSEGGPGKPTSREADRAPWSDPYTYVPTVQGWLYLACVTDVYSRMILGWSMASHRETDLVVDAVTMAVHRRGGHVPGVIHHSDRGGEYSSHDLEWELRRHSALASMGSVADCFDNALAESVFATLECELFDQQPGGRFTSRHEAKLAVFDYLETFYNPGRRHSAIGQISPAAFEQRYQTNPAA